MEGEGSSGGRACGGFQGADAGTAVKDTSCEGTGQCDGLQRVRAPPFPSCTVHHCSLSFSLFHRFPQYLVKRTCQAMLRCAQASALLRSFQAILKLVVAGLRLARDTRPDRQLLFSSASEILKFAWFCVICSVLVWRFGGGS